MCGIVGYIGTQQAAPLILEGLEPPRAPGLRLRRGRGAQRGQGVVAACRQAGRTGARPQQRDSQASRGRSASGTPGGPPTAPANDVNAHPHTDAGGRVAVVHNGIIENAAALRAQLSRRRGTSFVSDTDTEVLAHLIARSDAEPSRRAVRAGAGTASRAPTASPSSTRRPRTASWRRATAAR